MPRQESTNPQIKWEDNQWSVTLPLEDGRVVNATWKPGVTYVVRIREAGAEDWSFSFETPITSFTFIDLKPDTEYELQVRTKNAAGEGAPAFFNIRTGPTGDAGNVVPFGVAEMGARIEDLDVARLVSRPRGVDGLMAVERLALVA